MPTLAKADWASMSYLNDERHLDLVREMASYHVLCPCCCRLTADVNTGELREGTKNSALHWSRSYEWPWVVLNGDFGKADLVLDAGGGHAVLQYAMAKRAGAVWNVDSDMAPLEAAAVMAAKLGLTNLRPQQGTLLKIPAPDGSFDKVVCVSVLEHVPEWRACVTELFRVARPGGTVLITMDVDVSGGDLKPNSNVRESDLVDFLRPFGPLELSGHRVLASLMPSGATLRCVCLKFRK